MKKLKDINTIAKHVHQILFTDFIVYCGEMIAYSIYLLICQSLIEVC